jgi:hypothetical protein
VLTLWLTPEGKEKRKRKKEGVGHSLQQKSWNLSS